MQEVPSLSWFTNMIAINVDPGENNVYRLYRTCQPNPPQLFDTY